MLVLPESRILEVHAYIVLLPSCGLKVQVSLKQEAFQVWLQQNGQIEMLRVTKPRRMNEKFL